jgi:hypothetical protein
MPTIQKVLKVQTIDGLLRCERARCLIDCVRFCVLNNNNNKSVLIKQNSQPSHGTRMTGKPDEQTSALFYRDSAVQLYIQNFIAYALNDRRKSMGRTN